MDFVSFFFGLYIFSLVCFSFVSHPVYYCLLLLTSSLSVCGVVYGVVGFSWYLILFCLVYVGGVYILFLFVSVFNPNSVIGYPLSWIGFLLVYLFSTVVFGNYFNGDLVVFNEFSYYLCTGLEGFSYMIFCLVLVLGFICVSIVVNRKDSFYR